MRRLIGAAAVLTACADDTSQPQECVPASWVSDQPSARISLAGGTDAQLMLPAGVGRYPDGTPAVVYVRGGWLPQSLPAQQELAVPFGTGRGVAVVYLDLPDDLRGAESRQAVGAALRFAAGEEDDDGGCGLADWLGGPLSGQLVVVGYSNGGNLAWSTLADPEVVLPTVDGVVTFETPAAAEHVLFDVLRAPYDAGSCRLGDALRVDCPLDLSNIQRASGQDAFFVDRDGDGVEGRGDGVLGTVEDPVTGAVYPSIAAAVAAADAGIGLWDGLSVADVSAFWAPREAPQQLAGAAARFPGLATVITATEVDHALAELPDAPHVSGMLAAADAAGVRWHRLNPDASYAVLETGDPAAADAEYPANLQLGAGDAVVRMPESVGAGRGLLTAAALELLDRTHDAVWSDDLEQVLFR